MASDPHQPGPNTRISNWPGLVRRYLAGHGRIGTVSKLERPRRLDRMLASLARALGGGLRLLGGPRRPQKLRASTFPQVRDEVKWPKIKSLEIDSGSWVGRHRRTSAGWTDGCVAPLRVATSMRRPRGCTLHRQWLAKG